MPIEDPRSISTAQLRAFTAIVDEGSYGRAAIALDITQSSISSRMKSLQAQVGAPLFRRAGRGVELTEAGERLLPFARGLLADTLAAFAATAQGRELTGQVHLGVASNALADATIAPLVRALRAAHRELEVLVTASSSGQLLRKVLDGSLHAAFVSWPLPAHLDAALHAVALRSDRLVIASSAAQAASYGSADEILLAGGLTRVWWNTTTADVISATGLECTPIVEVPIAVALGETAAGRMLAALPASVVDAHPMLTGSPFPDRTEVETSGALVARTSRSEAQAHLAALIDALDAIGPDHGWH